MVVCKYYLQGTCRFGDRCRYEHPPGYGQGGGSDYGQNRGYRDNYDYQSHGQRSDRGYYDNGRGYKPRGYGGQRYYDDDQYYDDRTAGNYRGRGRGRGGGHGSSYYDNRQQGDADYHRSKYTYRADQQQNYDDTAGQRSHPQSADQPQTTAELLAYIGEEMEVWESSGMWPFSCFSFTRDATSLPGLDDLSMEEVRLNAYEAKSSGNFAAYVSWVAELAKDYAGKRSQLKRPTGAIREALIQVLDEFNRSGAPVDTAAGQKAFQNVTGDLFTNSASIQPSAGFSTAPANTLVQPTMGFGTAPAFGSTDTSAQPFGASAASAFAGPGNFFPPAAALTASEQLSAVSSQPSVFGGPSTFPPQTSNFAGFGGTTAGTASLFGSPAQSASVPDPTQSHPGNVGPSQMYTPLTQLGPDERAQYEAAKFMPGRVPVQPPPRELI